MAATQPNIIEQYATPGEIEKIPRSNSPYDYHPASKAVQYASHVEIQKIPRSNSPYDYHSKQGAQQAAPQAAPQVIVSSQCETSESMQASSSMDATPVASAQPSQNAPSQSTSLLQGVEAKHGLNGREYMKHLWYCNRCMLMDEAAGLNDPWGFSSAGNSRQHSPAPMADL